MQGALDPDNLITYSLYQITANKYLFASLFIKDKCILEVGCGKGYGAYYLASKGAIKVIAGDIDQEAIKMARIKYRKDHLEFICLDASNLPFRSDYFDVVIAFDLIEHLQNYESFLKESHRVLKNEGTFLCATPNKDAHFTWIKSPYHVYEFSEKEFFLILGKYYDQIFEYGQVLIGSDSITSEKIKGAICSIGSRLFSSILFGSQIKKMLNLLFVSENRLIEFDLNFDKSSEKYRVLKRTEFGGTIPKRLLAVAIKGV